MSRVRLLVIPVVLLATFFQIYISPLLKLVGIYPKRVIGQLGPRECLTVPELRACEKLVLHQPSGLVYLACSTLENRVYWMSQVSGETAVAQRGRQRFALYDYLATYDPTSHTVTRLNIEGKLDTMDSLALHGMDVVQSDEDPTLLHIYLVNHRLSNDSVVEVLQTRAGSDAVRHIRTVHDPEVIMTPNDVSGSADGKSFYFTNDRPSKNASYKDILGLFISRTSVGYCHIDTGCRIAKSHLPSSNGIVRSGKRLFVASLFGSVIHVLEEETAGTLIVHDKIPIEYPIDNLTVDKDGDVFAAALPDLVTSFTKQGPDPWTETAPSTVFRISEHDGQYEVEKVFEDDGSLISGISTAVFDSERRRIIMHGLMTPQLVACTFPAIDSFHMFRSRGRPAAQ
ncbi:hypothetical protein C8J56DRAFT_916389 [Mycena floridula]|nr:hypothetical protein C8J56DRAFT_916389 [Mycena floridula]